MNFSFDVKKFLSLPLNGGSNYIGGSFEGETCGCIKGNFARSMEKLKSQPEHIINQFCAVTLRNLTMDWDTGKKRSRQRMESLNNNPRHIYHINPQLSNILDRSECMLINGKPQLAKLFLIRALRMAGFIPKTTDENSGNVKLDVTKEEAKTLAQV